MKKLISPNAAYILNLLHTHGYEAFFVGGCVRDYLLNRTINDYDITTSALPEQMVNLANSENINIITSGIKHGTVAFILNKEVIECTTYRTEGKYSDNRHPDKVSFTTSLKDDLIRRDFTINALCYDGEKIIDYTNGINDLNNHIIRAIGDADKRFKEDALRIMRAIRFSCTLHFDIDPDTLTSIINNSYLLNNIARERIRDELIKILESDEENILIKLKSGNVLHYIIKEYQLIYDITQETPYHIYNVFDHCNVALNASIGSNYIIRTAVLLHDIGKSFHKTFDENGVCHFKGHAKKSAELSRQILNNLKYSRKDINYICKLIFYHDYYLKDDNKVIRKFLYKLNGDIKLAKDILQLQIFDNMGKNPAIIDEKNGIIYKAINRINQMEINHECFCIKDLKINGHDLIDLDYPANKIGECLDYILRHILNQQDKNNREYLLKYIRRNKDEILNC